MLKNLEFQLVFMVCGGLMNATMYGNGSKFVNFTQSGNDAHGLIYYATDGCVLNYVQMTDGEVLSGELNVGGLIGIVDGSDGTDGVMICGCSVSCCNVSSIKANVGGLIGRASSGKICINASLVDHTYVKSSTNANVGGLVGSTQANSPLSIENSCVKYCEICSYQYSVGGLVGATNNASTYVNASVSDCKVWANVDGWNVGGLIGCAAAMSSSLNGCVVEKCTILALNDNNCGGLVGNAQNEIMFTGELSLVTNTWVNGVNSLGSIIGFNETSYAITGNSVTHTNVYNGTDGALNTKSKMYDFDNTFDGTAASAPDGIGSQIGKTLFAGTHYGYGSARYITYDANGATGTVPASQTYAYGSTVTVPGKGDLSRFTSEFLGWYNESTGLIPAGGQFTLTEDVTLYANWSDTIITTADELEQFADMVNSGVTFEGETVKLGADIDLSGKEWTPIGSWSSSKAFSGTFDGQNHLISNCCVNLPSQNGVGIFGYIHNAEFKNLVVISDNISGNRFVGSVIGATQDSEITNIHVTIPENVKILGSEGVGGVIGRQISGTDVISKIYVTLNGKVSADWSNPATGAGDKYGHIGGVIGWTCSSGVSVLDISITGNGWVDGEKAIGGFLGKSHSGGIYQNISVDIDKVGNLSTGRWVGGAIGIGQSGVNRISNVSVSVDDIEGSVIGGLIGYTQGGEFDCNNICVYVKNLTAAIIISGYTGVGGILGANPSSNLMICNINNASSVIDTINLTTSDNVIGGIVGVGNTPLTMNVNNSISLVKRILGSSTTSVGRISGNDNFNRLNNYAWDGMTVFGNIVTSGTSSDKNGANASSIDIWNNQSFFEDILGWDFVNTWEMSTAENFKIPVLKGRTAPDYDASYLKPPLVFNPSPGTMTNTYGVVYAGCSTVVFETPKYDEHTFNGWNTDSSEGGTLLIDKDGKLQPNVGSFTDENGIWKDASGSPLTVYANWSKSAAPEVNPPTVTINLSVGEMTKVGGTYTGYVVVNAPSDGFDNWSLGAYSFNFSMTGGAKVSGLKAGKDTSGSGWSNATNEDELHINGLNGTIGYLTGKDQISIVNFTIDPSSATNGASINLSSTEVILDNKNGFKYTLTAAVNRTLDATAPNSVINVTSTPDEMKTEDKVQNTSLFMALNEFAQSIDDNYEMTYEIESENNLTKVIDDGDTYFIALNGTGTNNITATLKSISGTTLDVYTLPITFAKNTSLTSAAVVYSGPSEFTYTGSGFKSIVEENLSKVNHNNATAAGITRTEGVADGYARSFSYGVTYKNATGVDVDDPKEPGVYTFNVTVTPDNDYSSQTLTGYSFTITSKDLEGVWTTNADNFSAVNKSTGYMTYACPTGIYSVGAVLKDSTTAKYKYAQSEQEFYLGLNLALTKDGTNLTAGSDYVYSEPTIRFLSETHPTSQNDNGRSTVFYFVGHYLGDVTYDDKVSMADALLLAQRIATGKLTDENNLYGQVTTTGDAAIITDAIDIARYEAHLLDEHYVELN